MNNPRWDVLAATITASMKDVNMRQVDLVRESGLSIPTIRAFMSGKLRSDHPTEFTIRRLEEGLMWPSGAVERILAGEDPDRVLEAAQVVSISGHPAHELSPELQAELDERYLMSADATPALAEFALVAAQVKEMRDQQAVLLLRVEQLEAALARRRPPRSPSSSDG